MIEDIVHVLVGKIDALREKTDRLENDTESLEWLLIMVLQWYVSDKVPLQPLLNCANAHVVIFGRPSLGL